MTLKKMLILYGMSLAVFLVIDMIWLGVIARGLYRRHLAHLLSPRPNWPAAIVFYLLFVGGVLTFVVLPAISQQSLLHALTYGLLFGLITYATYDLTNLATLRDWPLLITVVDLLWGSVLCAIVSVSGTWLYFKVIGP